MPPERVAVVLLRVVVVALGLEGVRGVAVEAMVGKLHVGERADTLPVDLVVVVLVDVGVVVDEVEEV